MYKWEIAKAYLDENPLTQQHIDSYNEFMEKEIHEIIKEQEDIETDKQDVTVKLHGIEARKPKATEADGARTKILPHEARLRDRTYASALYMDMSLLEEGEETDRDKVFAGKMPTMVKSNLCYLSEMNDDELIRANEDPDDPGGYFIINGSERVLIGVEELALNRVMSTKKIRNGKTKTQTTVRSQKGRYRSNIRITRKHRGELKINYPNSPRHLNLMYVLRALGLETKNDILNAFSDKPHIQNDVILNLSKIEESLEEDPIEALGKRVAKRQKPEYRESRVRYHLNNYLLRHMGNDPEIWMNKAHYLVRMAEKGIETAKGIRKPDDRDHYANKRIKISGELIKEQFRTAINKFKRDVKYQVDRTSARGRRLKIKTLVRSESLSQRLGFAFRGGEWAKGRTGVSQMLDAENNMAKLSHLRRVKAPIGGKGKMIDPRELHGTHFGRLCPLESPEGGNVGLIKHLATGCTVSSEKIDQEEIKEIIESMDIEKIKNYSKNK